MSGIHNTGAYTLSIAAAANDTTALSALTDMTEGQYKILLGSCVSFTVFCPAALTGSVTMQVKPTPASASWTTLQSGGADIAFAAGKAVNISNVPFGDFRLHSNAAEGAQRDFQVIFQIAT